MSAFGGRAMANDLTHLTHPDALSQVRQPRGPQKPAISDALTHPDALCIEGMNASNCWRGARGTQARVGARRESASGASGASVRQAAEIRATRTGGMRTMAEVVANIVEQAARLSPPSGRNPHQFHEQKSDLADALKGLAEMLRTQA